ncbi:MAG: hypothetical protein E6Q75_02895 [Rheinheimera sp.]|nr:MAG: hypothetical protein E6Q75_02895 [Rheinheimera sp.]
MFPNQLTFYFNYRISGDTSENLQDLFGFVRRRAIIEGQRYPFIVNFRPMFQLAKQLKIRHGAETPNTGNTEQHQHQKKHKMGLHTHARSLCVLPGLLVVLGCIAARIWA